MRRPLTHAIQSLFAAVVAAAAVLVGVPASAFAAGPVEVVLHQVDGTPDFDSVDGPGLDSGPANGIVRTNDNLTYLVEVSIQEGGSDEVGFIIELPRGVEAAGIPPYCLPGSTLEPALLPEPSQPLDIETWFALPSQTLSCVVGERTAFSTFTYPVVARVRPEVPNGSTVGPTSAVAVSTDLADQTGPYALSNAVEATVSARARFDISANGSSPLENRGHFHTAGLRTCADGSGRTCQQYVLPMTIAAAGGGKGTTPLQSPVTFTDDLSIGGLFGADVLTDPDYLAAGADANARYGPILVSCGGLNWKLPHATLAGGSVDNAVRNSGSTTCAQPDGPGTTAYFSVEGMDSTAYTVPTLAARPADHALPADEGYVYVRAMVLQIPIDAVRDLGLADSTGTTWTLNWNHHFDDFEPLGIDGVANDPAADRPFNDHRGTSLVASSSGRYDTFFAGVPGAIGNVAPQDFNPGWAIFEGPAAATGRQTGEGQIFPGQQVLAMMHLDARTGTTGDDTSFVACNGWDPSALQLMADDYPASTLARAQQLPSGGAAVWLHGRANNGSYASPGNSVPLPDVTIQYGDGVAGQGMTCGDDDSPSGWFDDPAAVPGNDPTLAADGIYTAVTKVRVHLMMPANSSGVGTWSWVAVGLRAAPDLESDEVVATYGASKIVFADLDMAGVLASPGSWRSSTYRSAANLGILGDRLTVGGAVVRLAKQVRDPNSEAWVTSTPAVTGGQEIDYRLLPSLTAGAGFPVELPVRVEDCLPYGLTLESTSVDPSIAADGAPADAELDCASGRTYLRWDFPAQLINEPIEPITYSVRVSPIALSGTKDNEALVSSPNDSSDAAERSADASVQVIQPIGIELDKVALTPLIEINRPGETNPDLLRWRIDMINVDTTPGPSDVDIIDLLPTAGVGGTQFTGSLELADARVLAGGSNVRVLMTAADPDTIDLDGRSSSNQASGSTVWCDTNGAVVSGVGGSCPAGQADITALRILRPGTFGPGDQISVEVAMLPSGNASGDVYANVTAAVADDLELPVGPVRSLERVIASSISDRVWHDIDGDGTQDAQEPGLADVVVTLNGVDSDGNVVELTTVTDGDGQYRFDELQSGRYDVQFVLPTEGPLRSAVFARPNVGADAAVDSDGDVLTGLTVVELAGNTDRTDIDQGILDGASITGSVLDEFDAPLPGIELILTGNDDAGAITPRTALTGPGGTWAFDALRPGTYTVTEQQPAGFGDGEDTAGSLATVTGDDAIDVSLVSGDQSEGTVFVERYATISGRVFHDHDDDGIQASGDAGIAGTVLTLTGLDVNRTAVTASVVTDAEGNFSFGRLLAGTYDIVETQPVGYLDGLDLAGDLGGDTSVNDRITAIRLPAGNDAVDYVFAETGTVVSGMVWIDSDRDGVSQPSEAGRVGGVEITLLDSGGGEVVSLVTEDNGTYLIHGIQSGEYTVVQGQPDGYGSTTPNEQTVVVPPEGLVGVDFGENLGSISGTAWNDDNGDGRFFGTVEDVRANVTIELVDANGDTVQSVPTNAAGDYHFADLPAGTYWIRVVPPADEWLTVPRAPGDVGADSDISWDTALSEPLRVLASGCSAADRSICPPPLPSFDDIDVGLVAAEVDLQVVQRLNTTGVIHEGRSVEWTIAVTNQGETPVASAIVAESLPPSLRIADVVAPGWTCSVVEQLMTCRSDAPLLPGEAAPTIRLITTVEVAEGSISTEVRVSPGMAGIDEVEPSNNLSVAGLTVTRRASVLAFTGSSPFVVGLGVALLLLGSTLRLGAGRTRSV